MRIGEVVFEIAALLYLCPVACVAFRTERRKRANVNFDTTCSRDCSQTNPMFLGDTDVFNCSVGNLSEVRKFRENYKTAMKRARIKFDAPKLQAIDFYYKRYDQTHNVEYEAALNITFQLPKGKSDGYQETKYPMAVFLKFQGVDDPDFNDSFYSSNSRERIFQFWDYNPKILFHRENPRNISYDCLVGLDRRKDTQALAYTVTLETAFGLSVTYNCTVYVKQGREQGYTTEWLPAIATYLNESGRSLEVVFEEYPLKDREPGGYEAVLLYYNVSLILLHDRSVADFKKVNPGNHIVSFKGLQHGVYVIQVSKCEEPADKMYSDNKKECISTFSYRIDARNIPSDNTQDSPITYAEDRNSLLLVLAVCLGCLIGLTIVAVLALMVLKKRTKRSGQEQTNQGSVKGVILHCSKDKESSALVEKFAIFFQKACNCEVHVDLLEKETMTSPNIRDWYSDIIKKSTFAIIICSNKYNNRVPQQHDDITFKYAIQLALDKEKMSNNIHIIPVQFSLSDTEIVSEVLARKPCLKLMKDITKLYQKIHSADPPVWLQTMLDCEKYAECREGSELKQAIVMAAEKLAKSQTISLEKEIDIIKENDFKPVKTPSISSKTREYYMEMFKGLSESTSSLDSTSSTEDKDSDESTPFINQPCNMNDSGQPIGSSKHFIEPDNATNINAYPSNQVSSKNVSNGHFRRPPPSQAKGSNLGHNIPKEIHTDLIVDSIQRGAMNQPSNRYDYVPLDEFKQPNRVNKNPVYYQNQNEPICQIPYTNFASSGTRYDKNIHCPVHGFKEELEPRQMAKEILVDDGFHDYTHLLYERFNSYPQDPHSAYVKHLMKDSAENKFEFQAVNSYDHSPNEETIHLSLPNKYLNDKYSNDRTDSGFDTGIPYDFGDWGLDKTDEQRLDHIRKQPEKIYKEHQCSNCGVYRGRGCTKSDRLSASERDFCSLPLDKKREFTSDMFFPPEDTDSCLSDNDHGTEDIMDQMVSINEKMEENKS